MTWLFAKLSALNISPKMPDSVPPFISKTFATIVPAFILFIAAVIVNMIFATTEYGNIHDFIYAILQAPLTKLGDNIFSALFIMFLSEL